MTGKHLLSILLISVCSFSGVAQESGDLLPQPGRRGAYRADWFLRRAADNTQRPNPGGDFYTGEKHQLVVLASFADNPFLGDEAATLAKWDTILNAENFHEAPFVGSFHDYFYDQSYGRFDIICDLHFVQVDSCYRYKSTMTDDENSQYLVQDIMDSLKLRDIEWDRYDWNGDGYVNQLLIIYAGLGSKYAGLGPRYDAIWPHQWWLSQHFKDRQQNIFCDPDTVCYLGQNYIIDAYCAVQELYKDSTYGSFGTLCHEFSHCFGFPDFYYGSGTSVVSEWDIMDYGNYVENGFRPVGYSAHERWLMGWLTPVELTTPATVTNMPALSDQPSAYLIRNNGYSEEYYMLENRQKKGWDAGLPGSGLVVFHINYDPEIWISGVPNTYNTKHYSIIPANNRSYRTSSSGWAYPYVINDSICNNALTNTSEPAATLWFDNIDGSKLMSKPVTEITVTDSLVSFLFMQNQLDGISTPYAGHEPLKFIHNGQFFIRRGDNIYTLTGRLIR